MSDTEMTLKQARRKRKAALKKGERRYQGRACRVHRARERYTANNGCVLCSMAASQRHREKIARENPDTITFNGGACGTCGNTLRYVSNSNCKHCMDNYNKEYRIISAIKECARESND